MLRAVKAHLTRRGIQRNHSHAALEAPNSRPDFLDNTCQFMAEQCGGHDHARVVSALINFQIGSASQCYLYLHQYFTLTHARDRDFFDFHVLFTVEDGSGHLSVHLNSFPRATRLNHYLHRVRFRMGSQIQTFHAARQRKTMADQPVQLDFTIHHQPHRLIL